MRKKVEVAVGLVMWEVYAVLWALSLQLRSFKITDKFEVGQTSCLAKGNTFKNLEGKGTQNGNRSYIGYVLHGDKSTYIN
jgi:hypothetical protein